ncbi:hypothetical protein GQ42DRAFT_155980 [Ramicandelaber brevisporus]|nr:hypothetical protein GQ42DRAFT_155980 [Ramicandelaber brevisporus]
MQGGTSPTPIPFSPPSNASYADNQHTCHSCGCNGHNSRHHQHQQRGGYAASIDNVSLRQLPSAVRTGSNLSLPMYNQQSARQSVISIDSTMSGQSNQMATNGSIMTQSEYSMHRIQSDMSQQQQQQQQQYQYQQAQTQQQQQQQQQQQRTVLDDSVLWFEAIRRALPPEQRNALLSTLSELTHVDSTVIGEYGYKQTRQFHNQQGDPSIQQ